MPSDQDAHLVLDQFTLGSRYTRITALANHGGFSGARLWRVEGDAGPWCLRAWPENGPSRDYLHGVHRLLEAGCHAGMKFVPRIFRARQDTTFVERTGRLWEVTAWMPGRADFRQRPSRKRLVLACAALAVLHMFWRENATPSAPCPAVKRRLDCLHQWQSLVASGWRPTFSAGSIDPVQPWLERAWHLVPRHSARLPALLTPWLSKTLPVQPCVCDIWHDHVLYEGDRLTGLVDYGSVKMDHVAVDIARLLGSMVGDDEAMYAAGIAAYRGVRALTDEEQSLIRVLDESGTVLGAANWLQWLCHDRREYGDRQAVARRLAALVERMETWSYGEPGV